MTVQARSQLSYNYDYCLGDMLMSQQEMEARLQALEREVAALKLQVNAPEAADDWIQRKSGKFRDFPEWAEVCRLGAEWRKSQPLAYEDGEQDGS